MISKDTIALVRDRTDIVAVISESVPSLKKRGRRFLGLCPFHQEKTPSFHVNPDSGVYHCFGCKESGDVITFLIRTEGYQFHEAVRALAERAGIAIEEERHAAPSEADRHKREREALYGAMQMAATWYEAQLREHAQRQFALDELARRDLAPDNEAVQAFRVGYAPAGWDGLASFLKRQGVSPAVAESAGLIVPRSSGSGYYDRFRHRLMFAVVDVQGRVVAFSGRALAPLPNSDDASRDPPPKYINSPESPIYLKGANLFGLWQARHSIRQGEQAILVEGNFDVVSLHARGVQNVVAPLGTALTEDQAKLLKRFAPNVIILFDGDAAGQKATHAAAQPCKAAGLTGSVATIAGGKDPDELVRTKGVDQLRAVLANARSMLRFRLDTLLDEKFVTVDPEQQARRLASVREILAQEDDPFERMLAKAYADELAARIDLKREGPLGRGINMDAFASLERVVKQAMGAQGTRRIARSDPAHPVQARIKPRPPGSEERKAIAGAVLDFPVLLDDSEVRSILTLLEGNSAQIVAGVAKSMRLNARGEKILDTAEFLAQMPPAIQAFASARLAAPAHDAIEDARETVAAAAKRLRESNVARETSEIVREQHRVVGDWESEVELAKHANALVRQRLMGK